MCVWAGEYYGTEIEKGLLICMGIFSKGAY